jgi:hypothetical protein
MNRRVAVSKSAHVLVRVLLGVLIGQAIVLLIWIGWLSINGNGVADAIWGQVEDAIAVLESLALIAVVVGVPVGLLWGLMGIRDDSN